MTKPKLSTFIQVFGGLKQRVLWKYEDETIADQLPANVMVQKWLPQNDVLAHKNVILFITHGGIIGNQDGIYNGVPMLMIPLYGDQYRSSIKSVVSGYAQMLQYADVTVNSLSEKIAEMLSDKEFEKRAREMSQLFRVNSKASTADESMYWIKHVARHNASAHAKSKTINEQPWYIDLNLDILGALFFVIVVVVKIITTLLKMFNYNENSIDHVCNDHDTKIRNKTKFN